MEWTNKSIEELVKAKVKESNTLEFKRAASLDATFYKTKHDDLSKDVSAMANSNGGTIIYGIQEYSSGDDKCKAERIDFVDGNKISEEWLDQVIYSTINPRIDNVKIIKLEFDGSNCVFVVDIPKSDTAHQAQDNKYHKRFNFHSKAMEDWEVRDVMNRQTKPKINVTLSAYPERIVFNQIKTDLFQIDILVHNLGMVAANYINCFLEIDKAARKYIKSPELTIYENHLLVTFNNREEQVLKIGENEVKMPGYFNPLLPLVYKTLGVIEVRKGFLENDFGIICKVATESTFAEFEFRSNTIRIVNAAK